MSSWKRCERCRKVLSAEEYDEPSAVCRGCLTAPAPVRKARAAPAVTRRVEPAVVRNTGGVVGSGDLEVRERRARRQAQEQLAEMHAEEFEQLLQAARRAEGLRLAD